MNNNPCENCLCNVDEYCRCEKLSLYESYQQGARELAEWLCASYIISDIIGNRVWTDELLAEWQKGAENEM